MCCVAAGRTSQGGAPESAPTPDVTPAETETLSPQSTPAGGTRLQAHAVQLGTRLETRGLAGFERVGTNPLALKLGPDAYAFLFRFGAAAFIGVEAGRRAALTADWAAQTIEPVDSREEEEAAIFLRPDQEDHITADGDIVVRSVDIARLTLIAHVLATSVALAQDEGNIGRTLDIIEPLARRLMEGGRLSHVSSRELQVQIGTALTLQYRVVGRVEAEEKPDILWDHPELEKFFARLVDEYELAERSRIIDRKITLIQESAGTMSDLLQTAHSQRLEWYIVLLFIADILLTLYEIFLH